mmetsp:Transcript_42831/g.67147  ORF Transcript_42831/g.67147 Transcript_42831/m.67147 type:complete len:80 (-) Transcript_42831:64-303(-)
MALTLPGTSQRLSGTGHLALLQARLMDQMRTRDDWERLAGHGPGWACAAETARTSDGDARGMRGLGAKGIMYTMLKVDM